MEITTPSGLSGRIRKLKVREARILENGGPAAQDKTLEGVWLETLDPGPYDIEEGKSPPWSKALTADRFYTLMMVRCITFGPEFSFKTQCGDCGHRFEWTVKLTDLPIKAIPEDSLAAFKVGELLEADLGDKIVKFGLATAVAERKGAMLRKKGKASSLEVAILSRVDSVSDEVNLKKWALDLDFDTARDLIYEMDEADGGIETTIETECSKCYGETPVALPFDRPGFWTPKRGS